MALTDPTTVTKVEKWLNRIVTIALAIIELLKHFTVQ